jgi:hypothetical protein
VSGKLEEEGEIYCSTNKGDKFHNNDVGAVANYELCIHLEDWGDIEPG